MEIKSNENNSKISIESGFNSGSTHQEDKFSHVRKRNDLKIKDNNEYLYRFYLRSVVLEGSLSGKNNVKCYFCYFLDESISCECKDLI